MRIYSFIFAFLCIAAATFATACEDLTSANRQKIVGDWELVKGFRNSKETESLAGTTFHFGEDGKMATNLPLGIESPTDFEVSKDEISQLGRQTIKYKIKEVSDTTLALMFEMRGTEFLMVLERALPVQDSLPNE